MTDNAMVGVTNRNRWVYQGGVVTFVLVSLDKLWWAENNLGRTSSWFLKTEIAAPFALAMLYLMGLWTLRRRGEMNLHAFGSIAFMLGGLLFFAYSAIGILSVHWR